MPHMPTIDEQAIQTIEDLNKHQEEERSSSLTVPPRAPPRPSILRYRRSYSNYVQAGERNTLSSKRDLIHEMYLRSKQQYKHCLSNEEQSVNEAS